jgi:geranylgeranyl diphosphate synthase, type II
VTSRSDAFDEAARRDGAAIESRLAELVALLAFQHAGMREAIEYSLLGGGKRMRPLLCLWAYDVLGRAPGPVPGGAPRAVVLDAACAIECVHTYSLIHDDLPCMDNDDFRRGRPSSHRRFAEATAVLAGDALLNLAYEILFTLRDRHAVADATVVEAGRVLSFAAGTGGLITGQALDLETPGGGDLAHVDRIHEHKTGRLIAAAFETGAVFAGAPPETRRRFRSAGAAVGSAFQIVDDLLDLEGNQETLGKTPGKDVHGDKLTYPAVAGPERARGRAAELVHQALGELPEARETALAAMMMRVIERSS